VNISIFIPTADLINSGQVDEKVMGWRLYVTAFLLHLGNCSRESHSFTICCNFMQGEF